MDAAEASNQAEQMAEAMVARAAAVKRAAARQADRDDAQAQARMRSLVAAAREPKALYVADKGEPRRRGPGLWASSTPRLMSTARATSTGDTSRSAISPRNSVAGRRQSSSPMSMPPVSRRKPIEGWRHCLVPGRE